MTELNFWLWLSLKENFGHKKIAKLLEIFETPEQIFKATKKKLERTKGLSDDDVRLLSDKNMKAAEQVKENCRKHGIRILTYDSGFYPEKLKQIPDPPYVLYVRSRERINLNDKPCIAMVGNRLMTEYGRCAAMDIAKGLAAAGVVVVSGMARGIDGVSHTATLRAGGTTVAVLGCGLDIAYPPEHDELMEAIVQNGMVLSEYPPGTPPMSRNFPARNRIISGLSDGVVVVEAPEKSGALITADLALQQGRDVFAVPGDITRGHSRGTNSLIRQGAVLVASAVDVLSEYRDTYINALKLCINNLEEEYKEVEKEPDSEAFVPPADGRYDALSEAARIIISHLSLDPVHFDSLLNKTSLAADELSAELMMLEIGGFVKTLPGKNFILNV